MYYDMNNDNIDDDDFLDTVPEIKINKLSHNSINYGHAYVDNDYIGWKYKYPNTNDIVIVLDCNALRPIGYGDFRPCFGGYDPTKIYNDNGDNDENNRRFHDTIKFQISNWKNANDTTYGRSYSFIALSFTNDTAIYDILECVRHFVTSNVPNNFRPIEYDQIFTNNIIDYAKLITINMETYMIHN